MIQRATNRQSLRAVVAGGTVGADRQIEALDDSDKLQRDPAWARAGLVFVATPPNAQPSPAAGGVR